MKPCAHCGKWTCTCGKPAVALVATRECGGPLGRGHRMTGPSDAFCQHCLEGIARVHGGNGLEAIRHLITWLSPPTETEEVKQMTQPVDSEQLNPAPFDPATVPIEAVWDWLCERVPGLRESPGLGVPPNDQAGPLSYCEADLLHLLGDAVGIEPIWYCASLSAIAAPEECIFLVDIYAGYAGHFLAPHGQGKVCCAWGDRGRMPDKEARLRAAADLVFRVSKEKKP